MPRAVIYNGDCEKAILRLDDHSVDFVLTSPPYNISRTSAKTGATLKTQPRDGKGYPWLRYDVAIDGMPNEDYVEWQVRLFSEIARVLKPNGCVAYNISYGAENTTCYIDTIYGIVHRTAFTMADKITWKKSSALPNNVSPNRLTRLCEDVFILCRKSEEGTFHMNKRVLTTRNDNGQRMYENLFNFVEAPNNDGSCELNKATFSSKFAQALMELYCPPGGVVYDPFMGTGTTAKAALNSGRDCFGSELSEAQCEFAYSRLGAGDDFFNQVEIIKI